MSIFVISILHTAAAAAVTRGGPARLSTRVPRLLGSSRPSEPQLGRAQIRREWNNPQISDCPVHIIQPLDTIPGAEGPTHSSSDVKTETLEGIPVLTGSRTSVALPKPVLCFPRPMIHRKKTSAVTWEVYLSTHAAGRPTGSAFHCMLRRPFHRLCPFRLMPDGECIEQVAP